ncbi:phage holin family protein [Vampirovibrio chlorellavorus]|uniref:phage holin family protein n=1 Tax=Vampirovibrio chlorellavorus TaxID=758823 RepID=UPI0026ECB633|nr:phage holin family protein [Vampirovibrio chlorellavorus]
MSASLSSDRPDPLTFSQLVRDLITKVGELMTTQIALTKAELKAESQKLMIAALLGVVALLAGFTGLLLGGISIVLLLSQWLNVVWASLITTGLYLLVTGLLLMGMVLELRKNSERMQVDTPA